jgi:hypothetical protein
MRRVSMIYVVEVLIAFLLAMTSISAQTKVVSGDVDLSGSTYSNGNSLKHGVERKDADLRVIKVGPPTTFLKNGLSIDEVTRLLGRPFFVSDHQEGNRLISTYIFRRGEDRFVVADFAKGILKRSSVKSREDLPLETDRLSENSVQAKSLQ